MYFSRGRAWPDTKWLAYSEDLLHWTEALIIGSSSRPARLDSQVVEPGLRPS